MGRETTTRDPNKGQMSRRGIHPLLMGLERPECKTQTKKSKMTSYESAQRKSFLRTEAEDEEAREAG